MLFQVSSTNFITTPGVLPKLVAEWLSDDLLMLSFLSAPGFTLVPWGIWRTLSMTPCRLRCDPRWLSTLKCEELQPRRKLAGGLNYFLFFNHTWDVWLRRPIFFDMFGMDWSYQPEKDGPGDMNVRKPGPHCKWCLGNGSPPKMSRFLAVVDILPSGKHSELDNLHV